MASSCLVPPKYVVDETSVYARRHISRPLKAIDEAASEYKKTPRTQSIPDNFSRGPSTFETTRYHLRTLVLFIYSDAKSVLIPWTLFGLVHACCATIFGLEGTPPAQHILARAPIAVLWVAANLLPFGIGNQRRPSSIQEDSINKAWRPLPSKRITPEAAKDLLVVSYMGAVALSLFIGGAGPSSVLVVLGTLYNDLGGCQHWFTRNLLNGVGFISYCAGAMEVALGQRVHYSPMLVQWLRILVLVIFTGVQSQDLYDWEGDALVGRKTLPIVYGDAVTRWSVAASVSFWTLFCPWFWKAGPGAFAILMPLCYIVVSRTLRLREVKHDKKTWKLWNLWLLSLFCLPLVKLIA